MHIEDRVRGTRRGNTISRYYAFHMTRRCREGKFWHWFEGRVRRSLRRRILDRKRDLFMG